MDLKTGSILIHCFSGAEMDWVLVLDDAAKDSLSPGTPRLNR
jgi:hypothetical protein